MTKDVYYEQIKTLLARDYAGVSIVQSRMVDTKTAGQPLVVPAVSGYRSKTKSPLKEFFDDQ